MDRPYKRHAGEKWLLSVVLAGIGCSFVVPASAMSTDYVMGGGKTMFEVDFLDPGETFDGKTPSQYAWTPNLKNGTLAAISYWADILGAGAKNTAPLQLVLYNQANFNNASGTSTGYHNGQENSFLWIQCLQNGETEYGRNLTWANPVSTTGDISQIDIGYGLIDVGQYLGLKTNNSEYGWYIDANTVLPTNGLAYDYVGTIRHEMGHALGMDCLIDDSGYGMDADRNFILSFAAQMPANSWSTHLIDQYQNPAKPGMAIITSADFKQLQVNNPALQRSDFFIVDNLLQTQTAPDTSVATCGNLYFVGDNVTRVLDGATFDGISGLRINAWEYDYDKTYGGSYWYPEFSHIEMKNGMMSHQDYRNYSTFMEVELAVLQDLGYRLDRKKYYGRSIYTDNNTNLINSQGYSERSSDGTAYLKNVYSTVPLGIGLHVYGSNNNITQTGNILTVGTGAVGMRIDGTGNTITEASGTEIHADGYRGIGALIAYGSNQVLNQNGVITANGTGGNGVQFDFGSDSLGVELRGSYIDYWTFVNAATGEMSRAGNANVAQRLPEINGPLVKEYNIGGALSGAANAIYIGNTAFVKDINVNSGAAVSGNITSDWQHFATDEKLYDGDESKTKDIYPLKILYNGKDYKYDNYIPELVTHLNFNTDIAYSGNITGSDNLKLHVQRGTLTYSGKADVVNVDVAAGASLIGGTYTLNDMTSRMAAGFSDTTTGQFINHGTIMPGSTNMTVNGSLTSDGQIGLVTANNGSSARQIVASGTANINGSKLIVVEGNAYLPAQSYTFLTAGTISGSLANKAGDAFSGLLSVKDIAAGKTSASAALILENNIGSLNPAQQNAYQTLSELAANTAGNAEKQQQFGKLLGLSSSNAGKALEAIGSNPVTSNLGSITMSSTAVLSAIDARSSYLHSSVMTGNSRAREDEVSKDSPIIPVELGERGNGWLKFSRSWSRMRDGTTGGQGSAMTIGADCAVRDNWKLGGFFSYGTRTFSGTGSSLQNSDYRLGIYGIRSKGAQEAFVYADVGRQHNDGKRYFSVADNYQADSHYQSSILELGGRYSYDLDYGKDGWHKKPFVEGQVVRYHQDSYTETGAGVWNQHANPEDVTYSAVTAGLGFAHQDEDGGIEINLGYKRVLSGNNPACPVRLADAPGSSFTVHGSGLARNLAVLDVHAHKDIGHDWSIESDIRMERGGSEQTVRASATFRKSW